MVPLVPGDDVGEARHRHFIVVAGPRRASASGSRPRTARSWRGARHRARRRDRAGDERRTCPRACRSFRRSPAAVSGLPGRTAAPRSKHPLGVDDVPDQLLDAPLAGRVPVQGSPFRNRRGSCRVSSAALRGSSRDFPRAPWSRTSRSWTRTRKRRGGKCRRHARLRSIQAVHVSGASPTVNSR